MCKHSSEMLMNLINDILDFNQMKQGKFQLNGSNFNLE